MKLKYISLILIFIISSCGYKPLYKLEAGDNILVELYDVEIPVIQGDTGRNGQILRNNLMDMITPYGKSNNPRYKLQIVLQSPLIEQKAIRRDEIATFATVKNTADYTLIDIETGKELLKSSTSMTSSYNILTQAYASDVTLKSAIDDNLKTIANDIFIRLSLYFKSGK